MTEQAVQLSAAQFDTLLERLSQGNTGERTGSSVKSAKPVRPSIDIETTEGEWAIFEDNWQRFKRMSKLTDIVDIRDNLRQCCTDQLNKRLFDIKGSSALNNSTEDQLLGWIKDIAVKGVHKEVHRTQLVKLRQKEGQSINSYYSALKAESSLCDLRVAAPATCGAIDCNCTNHGIQVSYQDDLIATQLIAGLYNTEHQSKILAESANLPTLEDKLNRLLVLEKSDASLSSLSHPENSANTNFTRGNDTKKPPRYQKSQRKKSVKSGGLNNPTSQRPSDSARPDATGNANNETCSDCGKKHPQCRACLGHHKCTTQCNACKGMGHIRNCCPTSVSVNMVRPSASQTSASNDVTMLEEENVVCFLTTCEEPEAMSISHHLPKLLEQKSSIAPPL